MNTTSLLGIKVNITSYKKTIDQIIEWSAKKKPYCVNVCNVHSITSSLWTKQLRHSLLHGDLNTPDGMPLVWLQKLLGRTEASRTYGPTLMIKALAEFEKTGTRVGFYGGHSDRLNLLVRKIRLQFPRLKIVTAISPPFRPLTQEEEMHHIDEINKSKADVLWVGIGCPKQEIWMNKHRAHLNCVMVGVGAAFDFHAGAVKQAPATLQKMGLEWAYRLYTEPKRLWKRYLSTNSVFVMYAMIKVSAHFTRKLLPKKLLS